MLQAWTSAFTAYWTKKVAVIRLPLLYINPYRVISCRIVKNELVIYLQLRRR